ncbi:MAG: DegT/DnrJ/EryC1/StrS family aminotransferase [Candidatus Hodarchaeota archaeon]
MIPRYNWDYGLRDFMRGISSIFPRTENNAEILQRVFGQKPIPTSAGRTSLYAILRALDLPNGAQVGVPLYCCPVVFDAIKRAGLRPRFIDIDPDTYTISPQDLADKKKNLAAAVVVHMFGHPADMDAISDVVAGNFPIIEDCAQSLFSYYKDKMTGFFGNAAFFSFRSAKYISAGEGSLILANDSALADEIRKVVSSLSTPPTMGEFLHCSSTLVKSVLNKRPWYGLLGYPIGQILDNWVNFTAKTGFKYAKAKKSDLAIIAKRTRGFSDFTEKQRKNALYLLSKIDSEKFILPFEKEGCYSNYYLFAVRFKSKSHRDSASRFLLKSGVDNSKYLDEVISTASADYGYQGGCPNAEMCSGTVLVIPHYYTLENSTLDYIADRLNTSLEIL